MRTQIFTTPVGIFEPEMGELMQSIAIARSEPETTVYLCSSQFEGLFNKLYVIIKNGTSIRLEQNHHVMPSGALITNIQYNNAAPEPEIWFQKTITPIWDEKGGLGVFRPRLNTTENVANFSNSATFSSCFNDEGNIVLTKEATELNGIVINAYNSSTKKLIAQLEESVLSRQNSRCWTPFYSNHQSIPAECAWIFDNETIECLWPSNANKELNIKTINVPKSSLRGRYIHSMIETRQHNIQILFTDSQNTVDNILLILSSFDRGPYLDVNIPCEGFVLAGSPCLNPANGKIQVINKNTGMLLELDINNSVATPIAAVPLDTQAQLALQCDNSGASFIFGFDHAGQPTLAIIEQV